MSKLKIISNRIYSDYFMKNRFKEYEEMIVSLKNEGFKFIQIRERETLDSAEGKYVFLRHDIDSEPKVAEKMFEIEQKYGVTSTYYFRKASFDLKLAQKMVESGVEVGYHYEEISDYSKKNKLKSLQEVEKNMTNITSLFIKNTKEFEEKLQYKLDTVVSHGDWLNRKLQIGNKVIVTPEVKKELGLKYEGYEVEDGLDFRIADRGYPEYWYPNNLKDILKDKNLKTGLILIHPRQWCSAPIERFKLDFERIIEGLKY